ncbi:hypothetical protein A2U01_0037074 [Trifolium medium]|uniref:Uncharacterized protein n=1 Tax=Trifolium medium TaxID=97028 RepID=A0A392PVT7_9FABA|nr:hypothetical protein [Trifolium medium]
MTPYVGSDLQGYNGATTKPWGYVDLIVAFGINETAKSIKVQFLVVECPSLYQSPLYIGKAPSSSKKPKPTLQLPAPNVSSVDLDSRYSKKENKEENKLRKENKESDEASKEIPRPIPGGEFELVPLGEDPSKGVKIDTGLPDLAKEQLKACLRENADLFAWSATEMPGLDPEVACHQLTIY